MSGETILTITGPGVSPYSARGLKQSLAPIQAAQNLRRTINAALVDVSAAQFRKYASNIACTDQNAPAFDGLWPGAQVTVDCVATLSYKTAGGSPQRTIVPDSSYTEGAFTIYRPRLIMRVVNFTEEQDEYGAAVGWSLDLEEI